MVLTNRMKWNEASGSNFHSRSGFRWHSQNIVLFAMETHQWASVSHTLYLLSGWRWSLAGGRANERTNEWINGMWNGKLGSENAVWNDLNVHSTRIRATAKRKCTPCASVEQHQALFRYLCLSYVSESECALCIFIYLKVSSRFLSLLFYTPKILVYVRSHFLASYIVCAFLHKKKEEKRVKKICNDATLNSSNHNAVSLCTSSQSEIK